MGFPLTRLRRNRKSVSIRELVAESALLVSDLIMPLFIVDGVYIKEEIQSMPGVYRTSIDSAIELCKIAQDFGISAVALFPSIDSSIKSDDALEALNPENLICKAIKKIKAQCPNITIVCDVALDPYTTHGHDGLVKKKLHIESTSSLDNRQVCPNYVNEVQVLNDETIEILQKQALNLALAGADIVAPSDMMDGRIIKIRQYLDKFKMQDVSILSYSAKYNSAFYGPFREAVQSAQVSYLDKSTYQIDARNAKEAMREIAEDIKEGADIIMIKPAMNYLDVIYRATQKFDINIFAYQVSGEYSMIKLASISGLFSFEKAILESLIAIKRAGASAIFTYAALEVAKMLYNMQSSKNH